MSISSVSDDEQTAVHAARNATEGSEVAPVGSEDETEPGATESEGLIEVLNRELTPLLNAAEALGRDPKCSERFPKIVVVGDQSDGKSTVLEAISKVRFPRGAGLCTRCPIQLSLRKAKQAKLTVSYEINGKRLQKTGRMEEFKRVIYEVQDDLTRGLELPICADPIEVLIEAPSSFDLTLIDLPGINRKDEDMERTTVDIIKKYIQSSQTIIIVVFKATTDIQSVKGFQLAKNVDPAGERTFGVMTFCDALTDSTEEHVLQLLNGNVPQGIVFKEIFPVSCNQFTQGGPDAEISELSKRAVFRALPALKRGTQALTVRLSREVLQKLKPWSNHIAGLVKDKHSEHQQVLKKLLRGQPTEADDCCNVASRLVSGLINDIAQHITGSHAKQKNEAYSLCEKQFKQYQRQLSDITEEFVGQLHHEIQSEFMNQRGREFPISTNIFPVIERIAGKLITRYQDPTDRLMESVAQIVHELMHRMADSSFAEYPRFRDFIGTELDAIFSARKERTSERLNEVLQMERTTVFCLNPKFAENLDWDPKMGNLTSVRDTLKSPIKVPDDNDEADSTEEAGEDGLSKVDLDWDQKRLRYLSKSYLEIVKPRVVDNACMTLLNCLNHGLASDVQSLHMRVLDGRQRVHGLMQDPDRAEKIRAARIEIDKWRQLEDSFARTEPLVRLG